MVPVSRNARDWRSYAPAGIVVVILCAGIVGAGYRLQPRQPDITGYQHPEAPHPNHQAGGEGCRPENLARLPDRKRAVERERCADDKDNEKATAETLDYGARSANAAEQAVLVGYSQAIIMFWQTVAAALAFLAASVAAYYAKRAAAEAATGAGAAVKALEVAQKTHEAENRPWLGLKEVVVTSALTLQNGQANIQIDITIENTGNVPAVEILLLPKIIGNARQMTIGDTIEDLIMEYTNIKGSWIGNRIPARVIFPGQPVVLKPELVFKIEEGAHPFGDGFLFSPIIILVCCYQSPFDKTTKFTASPYDLHVNGGAYPMSDLNAAVAPIPRIDLSLQQWFTGSTAG